MCYPDPLAGGEHRAAELDAAVLAVLCEFLAFGSAFTAYEVTAAVRRAYPDCPISHRGGVREAVHRHMATELGAGRYACRPVATRGGAALQYVPVVLAASRTRPRGLPGPPPGCAA